MNNCGGFTAHRDGNTRYFVEYEGAAHNPRGAASFEALLPNALPGNSAARRVPTIVTQSSGIGQRQTAGDSVI
jgi:hypothetical protein